MTRTILTTILAATIAGASPARAQDTAWGDNGYVSFNALYDITTRRYQTAADLEFNLEPARLTTRHEVRPRLVYDFTAGGRVKGPLGFGFALTFGEGREDARITGEIPHPFFFNQGRALEGTTPLDRQDLAIHLDGLWLLPVTEAFQMAVFGGPTWFSVTQQTIETVDVDEAYPFDAVTLAAVTTTQRKGSRFGFNAGADASVFFSRYVGVQALFRYSKGTVSLGSNVGSIDVGGVQAGAGLRIRF
jgi:hypothetical protein